MRIGIDVDGVLANFVEAYERLVIEESGVDLFGENKWPVVPCTWNWPEHYGYSKDLMDFVNGPVWRRIKTSPNFWRLLRPLIGAEELTISSEHDVYFITDRAGVQVKRQTEAWLREHFWGNSTVLISKFKGEAAKALSLDLYVDDRWDNIRSVELISPATKAVLLDRPYNAWPEIRLTSAKAGNPQFADVQHRADSLADVLSTI